MAIQTQLNDRSVDTAAFAAAVATVEENSVTILSPDLLLKGEYVQNGDDLIIRGDLGEEITVEGYFSGDNPPVLETTAGAMLHPDTVQKLLINTDSIDVAGPAGSISIPGLLGDPIGTIDEMGGDVTAKGADGVTRTLQEGDPIYQNDLVETVGRSYANLRMVDDTSFQLGKETRAIIENYSYTPGVESGQFEATVVSGFFRYASGSLGGLDKGTHTTIKTPTAQIGVRGSEMEGVVESDGSSTFVHKEGVLDVSDANGRGTVTLDQPGMATAVSIRPGAPEPAFDAPDELKARFEEALPPVPDFVVAANEDSEMEQQVEALLEVPEADREAEDIEEFILSGSVEELKVPENTPESEESPVNLIPEAVDDTQLGDEDHIITGNLAENDKLGDGLHTWSLVSEPQFGTVKISVDGSYEYTPTEGKNDLGEDDSFTYMVEDANGDKSIATVMLDITPLNDMPTVSVTGQLIFQEDSGITQDSGYISLQDVDGGNLTRATITIENLEMGDELGFADQGAIKFESYTDGVLTLVGQGDAMAYEAALKSISFNSTTGDPTVGGTKATRTISWTVSDESGDSSTLQTRLVQIKDVNDAPTVGQATGAENTLLFTEGDLLESVETLFQGVSLSPVESNQLITEIVLNVTNILDGDFEKLVVDGQEVVLGHTYDHEPTAVSSIGYSVAYGANKTATITLKGAWDESEATNLISNIKYINSDQDPDVSQSRTASLESVKDNGVPPGESLAPDISVSAIINVVAVNDMPTISATSQLIFKENSGTTQESGYISLEDVDGGSLVRATIVIENPEAGDQLGFTDQESIKFESYTDGVLTLMGQGDATAYNAALKAIVFNSTTGDPTVGGTKTSRTFSWSVSDVNGDSSTLQLKSVQIQDVNNLPAVEQATGSADTLIFTEGDLLANVGTLFQGVTLSPVESNQSITEIVLSVTNVLDGDFEKLVVNGQEIVLGHTDDHESTAASPIDYSVVYGVDKTATVTLKGEWGESAATSLINNVKYINSENEADASQSRVVSLHSVKDNGMPPGESLAADINVATTVTINSAPRLKISGEPSYLLGSESAALLNVIALTDVGDGIQKATVQIVQPASSSGNPLDSLSVGLPADIVGYQQLEGSDDVGFKISTPSGSEVVWKYDNTTQTLLISGDASPQEYQQLLNAVEFSTTDLLVEQRSIVWTVTDQSGVMNKGEVKSALHVASVTGQETGVNIPESSYFQFQDSTGAESLFAGIQSFDITLQLLGHDPRGGLFSYVESGGSVELSLGSYDELVVAVKSSSGATAYHTMDILADQYVDGELNNVQFKWNSAAEKAQIFLNENPKPVGEVSVGELSLQGGGVLQVGNDIYGERMSVGVYDVLMKTGNGSGDAKEVHWSMDGEIADGTRLLSEAGNYSLNAVSGSASSVKALEVDGEIDLSALGSQPIQSISLSDLSVDDGGKDVVILSAQDVLDVGGGSPLFITSSDADLVDRVQSTDDWAKSSGPSNGLQHYTATVSGSTVDLYIDINIDQAGMEIKTI